MATCYASANVPLAELGPCNTNASESLCCTPGQVCLSNGLCATQSGDIYTGGCTDKTYSSAICPKFCTPGYTPFVRLCIFQLTYKTETGNYISQCKGSPVRNGDFCCGLSSNGTCCNDARNGLGLAPSSSSAIAVIPMIATALNSNMIGITSGTGLISRTTPSLTTSNSSSRASSMLPTTLPAFIHESQAKPSPKAIGLGLAGGLGGGILLGILIILGFCLRRHHYKKRGGSPPRQTWYSNRRHESSNQRSRLRQKRHSERQATPANNDPAGSAPDESSKTESTPAASNAFGSSELHAESKSTPELPSEEPIPAARPAAEPAEMDTDTAINSPAASEFRHGHLTFSQCDGAPPSPEDPDRIEPIPPCPPSPTLPPITTTSPSRPATPSEGFQRRGSAYSEGSILTKSPSQLLVLFEKERTWSWQKGDDECMQKAAEKIDDECMQKGAEEVETMDEYSERLDYLAL